MIKQTLMFSVIGLLLVVPFVIYDINAQIPSQVEILNPPQTCGLNYGAAGIDYGQLTPNQISPQRNVAIFHTGNAHTAFDVYGTHWTSPTGTTIMNAETTHWTDLQPFEIDYDGKTPLQTGSLSLPYLLFSGQNIELKFQVKAVLLDPTYQGALSQTVTIEFDCWDPLR